MAETIFTALLVLAALVFTGYSAAIVVRLYRGQG